MEVNQLTTVYEETLDRQAPHSYYPRPSLERDSFISLNGEWDFSLSKSKNCAEYNEKILVPFPPESRLSGIERTVSKAEYMHYRRRFTLHRGFINERVILHFGAVDQECEVYLNDKHIGENYGGYLPFSFDITDALTEGENTLYVRARDALDKKYPYGKQKKNRGGMWYTPVSGIWQSVWLESVAEKHIEELRVTPTLNEVKITVVGGEDEKILTLETGEEYSFTGNEITVAPENPINWSPENPHLYRFTLKSGEDTVKSYFALREIGISAFNEVNALTLNGRKYLFNGLLDQG